MSYLTSINPNYCDAVIDDLKQQAIENKIPIITDEGIHFLVQLLKISKAKKVLEIGSAIGYSSIVMAKMANVHVTTIEKDFELYDKALKNVSQAFLSKQIKLIHGDANLVDIDETDFDLLFIDAAKSSYVSFFNKFSKCVKVGGIIVSDNLLFRGQVENEDLITSKNRKQLIAKIKKYNDFVLNHPDFDSYLYPIGDGISVSIKLR